MLKTSYFHKNTHTEMFVPLITCVIDDTDGDKCSSRSTKFMTSMNWSSAWLMSGIVLSKVSSMCDIPIYEADTFPDVLDTKTRLMFFKEKSRYDTLVSETIKTEVTMHFYSPCWLSKTRSLTVLFCWRLHSVRSTW